MSIDFDVAFERPELNKAPASDLAGLFSTPKKLKVLTSGSAACVYDPLPAMSETVQTITIHFHKPFFLMSGVGMVYKVEAPPVTFKGYLSKCIPEGLKESDMAETVIEVTPVEEGT